MVRKKIFNNPFDASHNIMFEDAPEEYTAEIGMPGIFVEKINRNFSLTTGDKGELDSAYIADPDNKTLFTRVAVGLEHQSTPVSSEKLDQIGGYEIYLKSKTKLPTFMAVATHTDKEKSHTHLFRSPTDSMDLYFPDLGKEKIYEKLNMMNNIINSENVLTNREVINLGIIVLYAPREHACEITENVVELYSKVSVNLDYNMQYILYSVISMMIDAYFDDEKEYKELINMMDIKTVPDIISDFESTKRFITGYFESEEKLAERDAIIADKDDIIADKDAIIADKDAIIANDKIIMANDKEIIADKDAIIANDKIIMANDKEIIADKDATIAQLKKQIKKLSGK